MKLDDDEKMLMNARNIGSWKDLQFSSTNKVQRISNRYEITKWNLPISSDL